MKSLFTKYIWLKLVLSILLLFAGVLIIIFVATRNVNLLQDGLDIIAATILFLFGAFAILSALFFENNKAITNGLLYGSACIALGVFLCTKDFILLPYLVLLLSIFFIVIGAVAVVKGIILAASKYKNTLFIIATFVVGVAFIVGGILALNFKNKATDSLCIATGILLVIAGIYQMVTGIRAMSVKAEVEKRPAKTAHKENKKQPKEEVKEIDYTQK